MNNIFVKNGLLLGVTSIIVTMAMYLIDPAMIFGAGTYIGFIIPIIFMIKAAREEKIENEGYLSFGEGLKVTLLTVAIGFFISSIFSYILMTVIDPGLIDILKERQIEMTESMAEMFGADENAKEEMMDALDEQDVTPTIMTTILGYFMALIPYFIVSLIISAIMKKEDKSFA